LISGGFPHSDNRYALFLADQGEDLPPVLLVTGVDAAPKTAIRVHDEVFTFGITTALGAGGAAGLNPLTTYRSRLLKEINLKPHVILL
jgi:hypothetical protein